MDTEVVNRVLANGEHFCIKITFIFEWDNDGAARETGSPINNFSSLSLSSQQIN